jgi:hypothetical protein
LAKTRGRQSNGQYFFLICLIQNKKRCGEDQGQPLDRAHCAELCTSFALAERQVKRDLLQCKKIPITVSKETYYSVNRDLLQSQKRPVTNSKETYYSVKRDRFALLSGSICLLRLPSWNVRSKIKNKYAFSLYLCLYVHVYVYIRM